jgi:hypothetical protein
LRRSKGSPEQKKLIVCKASLLQDHVKSLFKLHGGKLSLELYVKELDDYAEYDDGAYFFLDPDAVNRILATYTDTEETKVTNIQQNLNVGGIKKMPPKLLATRTVSDGPVIANEFPEPMQVDIEMNTSKPFSLTVVTSPEKRMKKVVEPSESPAPEEPHKSSSFPKTVRPKGYVFYTYIYVILEFTFIICWYIANLFYIMLESC